MDSQKKTISNKIINIRVLLLVIAVLFVSVTAVCVSYYVGVNRINVAAARSDKAVASEKQELGYSVDLAENLRASTVENVLSTEAIPAYSTSQIMEMDVSKPSGVSKADLQKVSRGAFVGLEDAFLKAEEDYGVNCLFVMAIASIESGDGTICFRPNNMFGFGNSGFSSKAECIDVVSRALAKNYLTPGGGLYSGKTISSVNKRYATSSTWDDKVAAKMTSYYRTISKSHNEALEKLR